MLRQKWEEENGRSDDRAKRGWYTSADDRVEAVEAMEATATQDDHVEAMEATATQDDRVEAVEAMEAGDHRVEAMEAMEANKDQMEGRAEDEGDHDATAEYIPEAEEEKDDEEEEEEEEEEGRAVEAIAAQDWEAQVVPEDVEDVGSAEEANKDQMEGSCQAEDKAGDHEAEYIPEKKEVKEEEEEDDRAMELRLLAQLRGLLWSESSDRIAQSALPRGHANTDMMLAMAAPDLHAQPALSFSHGTVANASHVHRSQPRGPRGWQEALCMPSALELDII